MKDYPKSDGYYQQLKESEKNSSVEFSFRILRCESEDNLAESSERQNEIECPQRRRIYSEDHQAENLKLPLPVSNLSDDVSDAA